MPLLSGGRIVAPVGLAYSALKRAALKNQLRVFKSVQAVLRCGKPPPLVASAEAVKIYNHFAIT